MPRPSIEYLNARRAVKPASGGTNYRAREKAIYAPESDLEESWCYFEERQRLLKFEKSKQVALLKEYLLQVGVAVKCIRQIDEMIASSESEMTL
jgi:hypothetical protein